MTIPFIAIGLDGFEHDELKSRLDSGWLPNLEALAKRGPLQKLQPDTPGFGGMAWLNFVNALPVEDHGWYFSKVWRPRSGRIEFASPSFLRLAPFWASMIENGKRIGLIDVPYAPDPPSGFNGVYLNGWQTHDVEPLRSVPKDLVGQLSKAFGPPTLSPERYGLQQARDLLAIHDNVIAATKQIGDIASWLLQRNKLDLFVIVLGGTHRAGHYLWDLSQIDRSQLTTPEIGELETAMDTVYEACDEVIGKIIAAAPQAEIMAFSPHGMGPNTGWNDLLPAILERLSHGDSPLSVSPSIRDRLQALRRSTWAMKAYRYVPKSLQHMIGSAWSSRMHDWRMTRYFMVPSEVVGMVRLNLEGRDAEGIVPRDRYAAECADLRDQLLEVRDIESNEPIIDQVHLVSENIPNDATFYDALPDIVIEWRGPRLSQSTGLRLPSGAAMSWPRGRRISSGRSGDHRHFGWAMGDLVPVPTGERQPSLIDVSAALKRRLEDALTPLDA